MFTPSVDPARRGFTLVELLVVLSIILLLSAFAFRGLFTLNTHRVAEQSAARLQALVELGKGVAMGEREPVFLAVAWHGASPAGAPMRAYTLIRNTADPELLHSWQLLPKGIWFSDEEGGEEIFSSWTRFWRSAALPTGGMPGR